MQSHGSSPRRRRPIQLRRSHDGKHIYAFQHWETEEFGNVVVFEISHRICG
jgi:hypothetical protein